MCTPICCKSVAELCDLFGQPPIESHGIECAIQTLLHACDLVFFRVRDEGFSQEDYLLGLELLRTNTLPLSTPPAAICMPGVGDSTLITACPPHILLILSPQDLYDYLTQSEK